MADALTCQLNNTGCIFVVMTPDPDPSFRYLAGDPSLDLVNTVDWTADGPVAERLGDYAALVKWAEGAGVIVAADAARLLRRSRTRQGEAARVHAQALELRELIRQASVGVARGRIDPALLARLDTSIRKIETHRRLEASGGRRTPGLSWRWQGLGESLDSPLWPVVLAASTLLTSPEAGKIRVCEGSDCGWMYVDRSRNGLRRWCAMDQCGGREKARRHYARVKASRKD